MVLGRRELSVILLAIIALVFYLVLLSAIPSNAQTGGDTTSQNDEGCDNPQLVETFSGSENRITPEFEITGNVFRLSYETVLIDPDSFGGSLDIEVRDESGQSIGQGPLVFDEVTDSENILAGPGTFSLEITADNVEYIIEVEDCAGAEPTNGITVDDEITVEDEIIVDDEITVDDRDLQEEPTIIKIPNKPLPPTGGFPVYGTVAVFILMGAGLLGLGVGIRRGQRR